MARVVIVGCGVVGAMLAYELGQSGLEVCVLDQQSPAQGSTGAALGVLMGIISHKVKGRSWRLRETSLHRYETLIPELEERLGRKLAFNRQGVLNLCFDAAELPRWQSLQQIRQTQGYTLEIWTPAQVAKACPHLALGNVAAGIYSPQDRQIDPTALTLALVEAAQQQGVHFQWDHSVTGIDSLPSGGVAVHTPQKTLEADSAILAAGIGTTTLTQQLNQPIEISPVLGQALRLQLPAPLGNPQFQPVINGNDVHLVHLGQGSYWVGATVEFPAETDPQWLLVEQRQQELLDAVLGDAIAFCPALAQATITQTWYGLRPRPQGQPAPIITQLSGHEAVWIASGHYRNGVLLAPATALTVKAQLEDYLRKNST